MSDLITTGKLNIITIIAASALAESTKVKYRRVVEGYLATGQGLTDVAALRAYAAELSASRRGNFKSALGLWLKAVELELKGQLDPRQATPETVAQIQAALWRIEAMGQAVTVKAKSGQKLHQWLSQSQVKKLLQSCDINALRGQRDRIVLGVLTGAGLRRKELVHLTFEDLSLRPVGEKFRAVLQIKGKGAKDRVVPISDQLAAALDDWKIVTGGGYVARAVNPRGDLRGCLSPVAVFNLVAKAGAAIGKPDLAPHDLRRTYAQLGYDAGVSLTQISKLLGHTSVATTQRYLNLDLNLDITAGDFVPFE